MFELKVYSEFPAAHRLVGYSGRCQNLHGHTWKVEAVVMGNELNDIGLLVDFRQIKAWLKEIIEPLDHSYLNELEPFKDQNPSAETIARYIYGQLADKTNSVKIKQVTIWESERASATYYE